MTTKTTYAMAALVAVTVMSFSITPAFAYSVRDYVEFDDWALGSGINTTEGSDCDNRVRVTPQNGNTEVIFSWHGHNTCLDNAGHSGNQSHDFNKVRGSITIDGQRHNIDTQYGVFGQEDIVQTVTANSEIDVDFKWYYQN